MKKKDAFQLFYFQLGTCASPDIDYKELKRVYRRPLRYYHTIDHALECVSHFEQLRGETCHALEVEAALWYHDAIYFPQRNDNEERSAEYAYEHFRAIGKTEAFCDQVRQLILVTKHDVEPKTIEEKIVIDVDLVVLASDEESFAKYEEDIRKEYHFVADEQYKEGRVAILRSFLNRKCIYFTDLFHEYYEEKARANLENSIAKLLGN